MKQLMDRRHEAMREGAEDGGFTLIELLVVIVILAILAAVVVLAVGGIQDKGTNAACKADYKTVQTAEEAFYAQNTTYTNIAGLVPKYLASTPKLHDVTVTGSGSTATYAVNDLTGSNCTATNDT